MVVIPKSACNNVSSKLSSKFPDSPANASSRLYKNALRDLASPSVKAVRDSAVDSWAFLKKSNTAREVLLGGCWREWRL